jgi:hypothetical protein
MQRARPRFRRTVLSLLLTLSLSPVVSATEPQQASEVADEEAQQWHEFTNSIVRHVKGIAIEVEEMFVNFCKPQDVEKLRQKMKFARGDVTVPSCAGLKEANLETYYGNINLLMAEAWRAKVVGSLQALANEPLKPAAELLVVREPSDGMIAGGIFITQLLDADAGGAPTDAALMIGIHRMPRHKMLRLSGEGMRMPAVNVTPALVESAQEWTRSLGLSTLFVCPLAGDAGALRSRLGALGFRDATAPWMSSDGRRHEAALAGGARYRLGRMDLINDVCEEAEPMAWSREPDPDSNEASTMPAAPQDRDEL